MHYDGFATVFYGSFEIVRLIRRKVKHETLPAKEKVDCYAMGKAIYILSNVCAILFGTLILLLIAQAIGSPKVTGKTSGAGITCLFGLLYMILVLVFAYKNKKYIYEKVTDNKTKHIVFIVLTMIFVLPVGILYLVRFLKENKTETTEENVAQ